MAGGYRRVDREDTPSADGFDVVVCDGVRSFTVELFFEERESEEAGVALVQVVSVDGVVAESLEEGDAAEA